jgi:tRNA 2-thiouridine synthesizing protein A
MTEDFFDHLLDTSGLKCPLPVIRARKIIRTLSNKTHLKIVCTDPLAEIDIPHMASSDGHRIIETGRDGDRLWFTLEIIKESS